MNKNETLMSLIAKESEMTKSKVEEIAGILVTEFEFGSIEPLHFLGRLEFLSQIIEKAKAEIREKSLDQLEKYGSEAKAGVKIQGIQFKIKETGVKYDYSNTEKWKILKSEIDEKNEGLKGLEAQLKAIKSKQTIVDEETGEIMELNPPVKSSKTSIEITLPK